MVMKQENTATDESEDYSDSWTDNYQQNLFRKNNQRKNKVVSIIKSSLSKDLFLGEYIEKRYVQSLNTYRDIVAIENTEEHIIKCLSKVKQIIIDNYGKEKWIGITCNEEQYYLWVKFEQMILGKYWFKVQSVYIEENEIRLGLKAVRPFNVCNSTISANVSNFDINEVLNAENIFLSFKFCLILISTIIMCIFNSLPVISDFILRFMRECSHFIRSFTPIVLGIFELIARCIGGLYWMIFMLVKTPKQEPRPHYPQYAIRSPSTLALKWKNPNENVRRQFLGY